MKCVRNWLLLFLPVFWGIGNGKAQEKFELGVYGQQAQFSDRSMSSFGLQLHFPLSERFTVNYTFGIGASSLGGFYVRTTAGTGTGFFLLSAFGADSTAFGHKIVSTIGFFALFVPEGIGFYINPESKWRMHLNVNPLLIDYWKRKKDVYYEEMRLGGELLLRVKHPITDLFYIAPHAGVKYRYKGGYLGGTVGFTVGLQLKD